MELINTADAVIRKLLPAVLDAEGRAQAAKSLRNLDRTIDHASLSRAILKIRHVRHHELEGVKIQIKGVTYYCEKAALAAAHHDIQAFRKHVDKAHSLLREGMQSSFN